MQHVVCGCCRAALSSERKSSAFITGYGASTTRDLFHKEIPVFHADMVCRATRNLVISEKKY